MNKIYVDVSPMYPDAKIPEYQTEGSAGCDIRAYLKNEYGEFSMPIGFGMRGVMIPTGLRMAIPKGYYMAVVPRSGLSAKTTMRIANTPGTVDNDYRLEVKIIVDNIGRYEEDSIIIKHQDRIAQLIFLPYYQATFSIKENLEETGRTGGFESTGRN